jgi:hypothetical protein
MQVLSYVTPSAAILFTADSAAMLSYFVKPLLTNPNVFGTHKMYALQRA